MTVFEKWQKSKNIYDEAVILFREARKKYFKIGCDVKQLEEEYAMFNKANQKLFNAKEKYDKALEAIIALSEITLEEANYVFPKLLNYVNNDAIVEYTAKTISKEGIIHLVLQPTQYSLEKKPDLKPIYLAWANSNNERFSLYYESDYELLSSFARYKENSPTIQYLKKFIDDYIIHRNLNKVQNLIEFFDKYYVYGELADYDIEEMENLEYYHDLEKERHNKQRSQKKLEKMRQEKNLQIKLQRKIDIPYKYEKKK